MEKEQEDQNKEVEIGQFKAYPSIENHYRDKFIQGIKSKDYDKQDILWVCSQKIHGSNFSMTCFGDTVRYGRRSDFLTQDIPVPCEDPSKYFKQNFYDARNLVKKFHNNLKQIYEKIKGMYPDLQNYTIYGEYFGGNWPVDDPAYQKNGPKHVQKGVYYTPNHEFMAFDIFIVLKQSAFWVDVTDIPKILQDKIMSVPIYAKGTFDEVFKVDIKIDSTIPELLGLKKLQKNLIEGMVIRPNKNLRTLNNDRVIIKKKNQDFSETVKQPVKKKQKVEKNVDPQIAPYIEALQPYLNDNRIESAISKMPDEKDRNKIKNEIYKDIQTDAQKDEVKEIPTAQLQKKVDAEMSKKIMKALGEFYKKK